MRTRTALVALWLVATLGATMLAVRAMAFVRGEISEARITGTDVAGDVVVAAAPSTEPRTTAAPPTVTTTTAPPAPVSAAEPAPPDPTDPAPAQPPPAAVVPRRTVPPSTATTLPVAPPAPSAAPTAPPATADSANSTGGSRAERTTTTTRRTSGSSAATTTTRATTTTTQQARIVRTYTLTGGKIQIDFSRNAVRVLYATPENGWKVDSRGSTDVLVDVKFVNGNAQSRIRAWWDDGPETKIQNNAASPTTAKD